MHDVTELAARQRPLPKVRTFCGEVSSFAPLARSPLLNAGRPRIDVDLFSHSSPAAGATAAFDCSKCRHVPLAARQGSYNYFLPVGSDVMWLGALGEVAPYA